MANNFQEWFKQEYLHHKLDGEFYHNMLSCWDACVNNFPRESGSGQNSAELAEKLCKTCKYKKTCEGSCAALRLHTNSLPCGENNTTKAEIAKILTGIDSRKESSEWDGIGIVHWVRSQLSAICKRCTKRPSLLRAGKL